MALVPVRLSQRLTLGCIVLLILTAIAVFAVMALRGQPRVVAASGELIEQTGSAIVRQLALQLARIEGVTASLAHLAEVLPRDEALYLNSLPNLIDSQGDRAIAGGGVWPEPNAFSDGVVRRSFFWARGADGRLAYSDDYNADSGPGYHNDAWYTGARSSKAGECLWSEAYQDAVTGVPMVTCSVPYQLEGRFAGVATLDLLLDDLARFLTEQGQVTDGYAFALDQAGNVLHFPNMAGGKGSAMIKFDDLVQQHNWLKPVQEALASGSSGAIRNLDLQYDEQLDQASRISLFVMPDTGWVIGLATPQDRVTGLAHELTREILLFLLPLLAGVLVLAWLAGRKLIGQLEETTAQIDSLGRGSASRDVALIVQREDEIGALRHAVNRYAGQLRTMLQRIAEEAEHLQAEAAQLGGLSSTLAGRAEQQRQENTQLAAAITEMSSSAHEVAQNTNDCATTAQSSLVVVQQGQQKVASNSAAIQALSAEMADAASVISRLEKDSQQVGAVLDVIKAISEQTNLLALNAAIEAARAGEQGRGFAVVADEVRTLAGKTQSSANEIGNMINALQQASRQAVQAMQAGEARTQHAVVEAEGAASALSSSVQSFDDISQRAQQIAVAAQQQSHVTQEINELAVRIHSISEENARDAQALDQVSSAMQALSSRLTGMSRG
ncbi:methyl-accepting chemotaxis protein [Pseudomonas sp. HMWF032]|uniref:methyl-accepting chemotaxis protein n=2 Tax=unclassified Pseudomonas TaxID=196821 RepID=UPI000D3AD10F|nr:methyl-accepting chemotaxis protein [Pseudomonas sp. HMWF032]PTS84369.1 methyl-accepting chemotaxis protein [Pseudomonas sp. HMWF032]PTT83786.1 methyl-accepting chemotaxis protein [Pseudomonas sp. HMWF010]